MNHKSIHKYKGQCLYRYCKEHGIKYHTVLARRSHGWSDDDSVEVALKKPMGKPKYHLYIDDLSVREFCRRNVYKCYNYVTFLKRYKSGLSKIVALFGGKYRHMNAERLSRENFEMFKKGK